MKKDIFVHLDDILESCNRIEAYIQGVNKETFERDYEMQDAVIRRLEIIGEAIKRIPKEFRDQYAAIEWKKATGMRDILIHNYDDIDLDQIWFTITKILPLFKRQIEKVLQEEAGVGK